MIVSDTSSKIACRIRGAAAFNELKRIAASGDCSEAATFRSAGHRNLGDMGTSYLINMSGLVQGEHYKSWTSSQ